MKRALKLVASLLVTVLFTWLAFRNTDVDGMLGSLKTANWIWMLPYLGILAGIHLTRTLRWGCLLSGMEKVPFRKLNQASAIGFMMLIILPFRLGEFARPFLIAQRSGIRRSEAMATVVLERIIDGITIATLLRVLLFFVPYETKEVRLVRLGSTVMFAVFGGGLTFLLFATWQQERAVWLVRKTAGLVSPKLAEKIADVTRRFVGALRQLPRGWQMFGFFFYTFAYWTLNGFGMSLLSRAFDCEGIASVSCVPMTLSIFQGYVVLSVLVVGLMIPAAPGMVGTFQAAIAVGLLLFLPSEVVNSQGLAYANTLWLTQTLQQILFGFLFLFLGGMSFRDIAGKLGKDDEPKVAA